MNLINSLYAKFRSLNVQLRVVFWFAFAGFLQRGISIITTPIFTRVLTTDEYGLFSVFSAWFYVLVIVCTLNIHMGAINNTLTKMPSEKNKIIAAFQSVSLIVSGGFFIIALIFSDYLSKWMNLPRIIIVFMFLGFMFYEPYNDWLIYKRYEYDYKKPVITSVIISIITPVISIITILVFSEFRGEARVISFLIVNIIIPGFVFYFINYKSGHVFFDKKLWTYALFFNVPLIPHFLSETILNQSDKIMIGSIVGTSEAGVYSVSYSAASLVLIFSSALNTAFVPWQYQKIKDKEYSKLGKISYVVLSSVGAILIILILFSPEIIKILAGESYMGAVKLVPILGISVFFNYMYQIFARVELYYEKKIYTVIATFGATLLNVSLNFLWIPRMGYTGAGYSTLIAHVFLCLIHYIFYRKICVENTIEYPLYKGTVMLLISVVFMVCSLSVVLLYNFFVARILIVITIVALMWFFHKRLIKLIKIILNQ